MTEAASTVCLIRTHALDHGERRAFAALERFIAVGRRQGVDEDIEWLTAVHPSTRSWNAGWVWGLAGGHARRCSEVATAFGPVFHEDAGRRRGRRHGRRGDSSWAVIIDVP